MMPLEGKSQENQIHIAEFEDYEDCTLHGIT